MGKWKFRDIWLEKDEYKPWLSHDKSELKAKCLACHKSFDVNNMGEMAIVSHMKGKKHNECIKRYTEPRITSFMHSQVPASSER